MRVFLGLFFVLFKSSIFLNKSFAFANLIHFAYNYRKRRYICRKQRHKGKLTCYCKNIFIVKKNITRTQTLSKNT